MFGGLFFSIVIVESERKMEIIELMIVIVRSFEGRVLIFFFGLCGIVVRVQYSGYKEVNDKFCVECNCDEVSFFE